MEIIEVEKLTRKEIPSLYCSPRVIPETEEEAVSWAEKYGVKKLYKFEQAPGIWLYMIDRG